ncbi:MULTISPECIES: NAD(P)-dependent oxidoreductase [Amycolatopsis]|nr:NAD(P)-dependent oxidoreductase [Amycolatopsis sp. M39]
MYRNQDNLPAGKTASVGVVGLGNMGLGMAVTLDQAGWRVTGYDLDAAAVAEAGGNGIGCVAQLPELAAEQVVLSLPGAGAVRSVVPELLEGARPRVIVDTTTSDPGTSREMAARCAEAGVAFVDAPVSGGRTGAWSGALTAFAGGTDAAVDSAAAVLSILTKQWSHLGPAGSGNIVKLLNNMLCAVNIASVAEAVDVLAAYGIDLPQAMTALNTGSGRSAVSQVNFEGAILKGELVGGFTVGLMARDVALGIDVATAAGARPSVLSASKQAWDRALAQLGPETDCNLAPSAFTSATDCFSSAALRPDAAPDQEGND